MIEIQQQTAPASGGAEQEYRRAVFAAGRGEPVDGLKRILVDAARLRPDFDRDVGVYTKRLEAARVLAEDVPGLRSELAELEARVKQEKSDAPGAKCLAEIETIGELFDELQRYGARNQPGHRTAAEGEAHAKRMRVESVQAEAKRVLLTSCDLDLDRQIGEAQARIAQHRGMIANRKAIVQAPGWIERLHQLAERLAGEPSHGGADTGVGLQSVADPDRGLAGGVNLLMSGGERLRQARLEMRRLRALLPQREAAVKADEESRSKIDELQGKVRELQAAKLVPERMKFTGWRGY